MLKSLMMIAIVMTAATSFAQGLSLATAEKIAEDNSTQLKVIKLERDEASWQKLKVLSGHLPHLEIAGMHAWDNKYQYLTLEFGGQLITMPGITPLSLLSVQASINIFDGGFTARQYQAADLDLSAKELELSRETLKIRTEIRTKFYHALGAQALAEVTEQNIKTLDQHLNDVNSQYRGGVSTRYDILRIEVQKEDARTESLSAQDNVVVARAKLFEALHLGDDGRPLIGKLPEHFEQVGLDKLTLDPQNRDDRQIQILNEESSHRRAQASHGYWLPKINLYAQKDWYNNIDSNINLSSDSFRDDYQFGMNFTWNLFDGGASLASERQAALANQISEQKVAAMNDQIPVEFENWKRKFQLSTAIYKAKVSAIKKAEESIRLARGGVRAGTRTNTEVLDAELDLMNAKAKAVKSQMDAVEALGNLEMAYGRSFARIEE